MDRPCKTKETVTQKVYKGLLYLIKVGDALLWHPMSVTVPYGMLRYCLAGLMPCLYGGVQTSDMRTYMNFP